MPGCLRSVDSAVPGRNADLLRVGKALTAEDRRLHAGLFAERGLGRPRP
jgi:hypothetical protein